MVNDHWSVIIKPKRSLFDVRIKELLKYWDLLLLFVKRDLVVVYKQTVLGPVWFFIQPILTTLIYVFVFDKIAKLSTDTIPAPLFYLSGIIMWNFFSICFTKTADTFTVNASVFGKVYYPRLINPLSVIISNGVKFLVQFLLFALFIAYYMLFEDFSLDIGFSLFLFPFLIILIAFLGLGSGLIFSSLTTKYKDLNFLLQFGVQLLMYATPVIYPMSSLGGKLLLIVQLNPVSHILEAFKYSLFGVGSFSYTGLLYSFGFTLFLVFFGIIVFNRTEKSFMDTV